jgi:hypothetical protein
MNCHECLNWLQRRLDGEPGAPELDDHLTHCPTCRGQHVGFQLLLDAFHESRRPMPSPGLAGRIVAHVLADRQARRNRLRVRLATTVALAASLLLAALAGYVWLPKSNTGAPGDIVKGKVVPERQPAVVEPPSLSRSVEEAGAAVASLTERIADKGKEQARLWWPLTSGEVSRALPPVKLEQPLDPAAQSLRQTGQGVSESLQTVAQSARRAVSYFFRELPPLDVGKSGG